MFKGRCQFWTGTFRQEKWCWIMTLEPNTGASCREIQSSSYKRRQYSLTSHFIGFYISLFVSNFAIKFLKLSFLAKINLLLSLCLSAVRSNLRGIWQAQGPSFPQKLERKKKLLTKQTLKRGLLQIILLGYVWGLTTRGEKCSPLCINQSFLQTDKSALVSD